MPRFDDTKASLDNHSQEPAKCTLKVETKNLSVALQLAGDHVAGLVSSALLCMVENEMLVVHVLLNPASVGFFTYYVPVHFLSSTELP
jgi:HUS1 checkpoint protein